MPGWKTNQPQNLCVHGAEAGQGLRLGRGWDRGSGGYWGDVMQESILKSPFSSQSVGAFVIPFQSFHFDGIKDSVCSNIIFKPYFNKGVAFYLYKFL